MVSPCRGTRIGRKGVAPGARSPTAPPAGTTRPGMARGTCGHMLDPKSFREQKEFHVGLLSLIFRSHVRFLSMAKRPYRRPPSPHRGGQGGGSHSPCQTLPVPTWVWALCQCPSTRVPRRADPPPQSLIPQNGVPRQTALDPPGAHGKRSIWGPPPTTRQNLPRTSSPEASEALPGSLWAGGQIPLVVSSAHSDPSFAFRASRSPGRQGRWVSPGPALAKVWSEPRATQRGTWVGGRVPVTRHWTPAPQDGPGRLWAAGEPDWAPRDSTVRSPPAQTR